VLINVLRYKCVVAVVAVIKKETVQFKRFNHIMVHHRAFFSSSSSSSSHSTLALEIGSSTGDSVDSRDSVDDLRTNSPEATSKEVLVLPSWGTMGEEENHPPGKNRDEVVDSSLLRVGVAEDSSRLIGETPAAASSSTDGKRSNESVFGRVLGDSP